MTPECANIPNQPNVKLLIDKHKLLLYPGLYVLKKLQECRLLRTRTEKTFCHEIKINILNQPNMNYQNSNRLMFLID